MLKERARILAATIFTLDLSLVAAAFLIAYWLRDAALPRMLPVAFGGRLYPLAEYLPLLPVVLAIWGALLLATDSYRSHRTVPLRDEATSILKVCAAGTVVFILTLFALRLGEKLLEDDQVSRSWLMLFSLLTFAFLLSEKLALRLTARYVRAHGLNYRTVLIVGTNQTAVEIARSIAEHRFWGFRIIGFVRNEEAPAETHPRGLPENLPVLGSLGDIARLVDRYVVDDVIFAVTRRDLDRLEDLFLQLQEQGIRVRFAMNIFPHTRAEVQLEDLDGMPILTYSTTPTNFLQLLAKRALDVAVSVSVLVLALPVILLIALAIKLSSGGTVLFRQIRCGLNGRIFTLYKFRTMVADAEHRRGELQHLNEMAGPVFKLRRDPRVTLLGRFLRRFSLDELPQLWNVLRGDMSLVGPRPPIPEEVAQYQRWQRRRLSMKPGLTCLWQISGRNNLDFDRWMQLDLEYIDSWSPMLDLKILLKTIPAVLSGRGAS
jgi:exopolysaccharide biosynthesis polyprenyl glycosylphosphotransferase